MASCSSSTSSFNPNNNELLRPTRPDTLHEAFQSLQYFLGQSQVSTAEPSTHEGHLLDDAAIAAALEHSTSEEILSLQNALETTRRRCQPVKLGLGISVLLVLSGLTALLLAFLSEQDNAKDQRSQQECS